MARQSPQRPDADEPALGDTDGPAGPDVEPGWLGRDVVTAYGTPGGYAELAVADVSALHPRPAALSHEAAVAMVVTGGTTMGILAYAGLRPDDVVLINSAAGGIGRVPTLYGSFDGCADTRLALADEGRAVTDSVERDARRLLEGGATALANSAPVSTPLPPTLARCLADHAQTDLHQAIGLIWVYEWLTLAADHQH